ncbi:MAG: CapA family protein, partial [Cyanobacteria bacterium J06636_27]
MLNQKLRASLSVGFVSCCFALGFGISLLMRFQVQTSQKNDVEVKTAIASLESKNSKKISDTQKKNTAKSIV